MTITIDQNPTISDEILFTITTTDNDGNLVDPDTIDLVTINYVERSFFNGNFKEVIEVEPEMSYDTFFSKTIPTTVLGSDGIAAWNSSSPSASTIRHVSTGTFTFTWQPNYREGDYYICWTWTLNTSDQLSNFYQFFISGDTKETTSIPTHHTNPEKYTTLLSRYMPDFMSNQMSESDLSPDVISRYNTAVAKLFTFIEDMVNQTVDLIDANATPQTLLPYLAGLFGLKLRSQDVTLWRRQIKQAIPLYKQKGTLIGLTNALANAGITLNSFSMLWQIVSPSTWQEGIKVSEDSQTIFVLAKLAILPEDGSNFSISIRPANTSSYMSLILNDYVTFSNSDGITTMTWIGESATSPIVLAEGDFLDVIYKISPVVSQPIENYIRSLPLADLRDEVTVAYPPKNWNVRLITEADSMFDVICSVKHPFVDPIIFGQVRTEFPYSENIYNMDEYNGSKRDSTNPCDLDKSFLDTCSCCRSSKFNIDVTINDLSDDRLSETNDIIREYKPFHLVPQNLSYSSSFYDIIIPPVESVDFLIQYTPSDNVLAGAEARFNRAMPISGGIDSSFNALNRISLATRTTVINSVSGNGFNQEYVLYAPLIRFDEIGLNGGSNLLEILSGTAAGNYTCSVSEKYRVHINQGSPDTLSYPLEVGEHHFRLSNIVYTDISASIFQDNLFIFSDSNIDFTQYAVTSSWNVVISNGTNPGTYAINEILPNNTLLINAWPGANISGLSYQLKDNLSNTITSSTTGSINIQNRGRVELLDDIVNGFEVNIGYYVLYKSNQYPISGFNASNKAYVDAYSAGTAVGTANIRILKRLVDNTRGYLDTGGMRIVSGVDYEAGLGIANGHGQSTDGVADTDSKFKENYLILFNGNYYKVSQWTGTNIYISGYKVNWGLAGTPITYSIVQYNKTQNVNIEDHVFRKIDRSGNDVVTITSESVGAMLSYEGIPGFSDNVRQSEKVSFIIEKVEA